MIVVISDLHLQHTRHDSIRHFEAGSVVETRIVRNVGAGALRLLLSEIAENVARTGATSVELVLAGDIFEIHRTPRWFLGGRGYRPVLHPPDEALERIVCKILDDIALDNREFFDVLGELVDQGTFSRHGSSATVGAPITVHYLPGNHDRLVDCFDSTRRRVRELLKVRSGYPSEPFPHQLLRDRTTGYGVLIRHGHEYDETNFALPFDPRDPPAASTYAGPAFGDYVTVDIATRLAVAFRAYYALKLRDPGAEGKTYRRIYAALTEFDDVRPPALLVQYLNDCVGNALEILRPVLRDVFEAARADSFFIQETRRLGFSKYFEGPLAELIEAALENLSAEAIAKVLGAFTKLRGASESAPAAFARHEHALSSGRVQLVVAGHTHEPAHVSIPAADRGTGYFLDSGTWRTRIDAGEGGTFGRLRAYTSVVCYHDSERKGDELRSFETWTGHLLSDGYGMAEKRRARADAEPSRKVRLKSCTIHHVDEGETFDGAELELHFGVDAAEYVLRVDGVKDDTVIAIEQELEAFPALDGEVWCWGLEKDWGNSFLDRDDPLPWAVDFLERDAKSGFAAGTRKLFVSDNRGSAITVEYEVL
jgi:UDP-2,3-diacylglucosamine pyrophosphatase LpxH